MLSLAVNGYSEKAVINQLHAHKGMREVKFRYDLLNKHDVKIGELTSKQGSNINFNSLAEIKRTATFSFKESELQDVDWLNDRIRPVFLLKMPGGYAEWPLGVFLISSPVRREFNKGIYRDIEAYDSSLILLEDKFDNRYRIPSGTKYTKAITDILNGAGIWKVNITAHSGVISVDKEFEIGTSKLEAINTLLTEINYTSIWVDENNYFIARPYVLPSDREADYIYRNDELSIIHDGASEELDLFNVPNKWVRYLSNPEKATIRSVYVNDLPTSKTSTINRGRTIVDADKVDDILDQATLDEYVKRLAYESSNVYGKFIFETALMPHHSYMNMLFIEHTGIGVSAKYTETAWSMSLTAGGRMMHNTRRVIQI